MTPPLSFFSDTSSIFLTAGDTCDVTAYAARSIYLFLFEHVHLVTRCVTRLMNTLFIQIIYVFLSKVNHLAFYKTINTIGKH